MQLIILSVALSLPSGGALPAGAGDQGVERGEYLFPLILEMMCSTMARVLPGQGYETPISRSNLKRKKSFITMEGCTYDYVLPAHRRRVLN